MTFEFLVIGALVVGLFVGGMTGAVMMAAVAYGHRTGACRVCR